MESHATCQLSGWTAFIALAVVLWSDYATCAAREVRVWAFAELFAEADVVVIGTVERLEDEPDFELDPESIMIPLQCHIQVAAVMKREVAEPVLMIHLTRRMTYGEWLDAGRGEIRFGEIPISTGRDEEVPVINGRTLAYESLRDALTEDDEVNEPPRRESASFILFLKVGADGSYEPVTGQPDSCDSVYRMIRSDR
jgi:hypothetical protein